MKQNKTTSKELETLAGLIEKAIEKYPIEDIVSVFITNITRWQDRDKVVQELLKDDDTKSELLNELQMEFLADKYVVQLESMEQREKLNDFVCAHIYPYYNQQQALLFSN